MTNYYKISNDYERVLLKYYFIKHVRQITRKWPEKKQSDQIERIACE